jgi:sec-independent protein translocase protein TatA
MGGNILTPTHLLLLVAVVLIVFGPKRLPEIGRGIGSAMREFKGGVAGTGNDLETGQVLESTRAAVPAAEPKVTTTTNSQ